MKVELMRSARLVTAMAARTMTHVDIPDNLTIKGVTGSEGRREIGFPTGTEGFTPLNLETGCGRKVTHGMNGVKGIGTVNGSLFLRAAAKGLCPWGKTLGPVGIMTTTLKT